jgi:hypothetical protein
MFEAFLAFLFALMASATAFDSGEGPNKCYVVDAEMAQKDPCKPEMTRGRTR